MNLRLIGPVPAPEGPRLSALLSLFGSILFMAALQLAASPASGQTVVATPASDAISKLNQVQVLPQWSNQLAELKRQYDQIRAQYAAVTGGYGRGQIGLQDSLNASSVVPGSWQEVVALQAQGAYGSKVGSYEQFLKTMPPELFQQPQGQDASTYKLGADSVRAAMAGGDALYSQVQTHLNNLARLNTQVDVTANVKDAQDLQNRIAVENGMLQSAIGKLGVMNVNLQANLLNR